LRARFFRARHITFKAISVKENAPRAGGPGLDSETWDVGCSDDEGDLRFVSTPPGGQRLGWHTSRPTSRPTCRVPLCRKLPPASAQSSYEFAYRQKVRGTTVRSLTGPYSQAPPPPPLFFPSHEILQIIINQHGINAFQRPSMHFKACRVALDKDESFVKHKNPARGPRSSRGSCLATLCLARATSRVRGLLR
jgi:hypothetical protein